MRHLQKACLCFPFPFPFPLGKSQNAVSHNQTRTGTGIRSLLAFCRKNAILEYILTYTCNALDKPHLHYTAPSRIPFLWMHLVQFGTYWVLLCRIASGPCSGLLGRREGDSKRNVEKKGSKNMHQRQTLSNTGYVYCLLKGETMLVIAQPILVDIWLALGRKASVFPKSFSTFRRHPRNHAGSTASQPAFWGGGAASLGPMK